MLKNVVRIFNKLSEFQPAYEEVKRCALPLNYVADILNPEADKSSDSVQFHLQHLLQWVEQTYNEEHDKPMVAKKDFGKDCSRATTIHTFREPTTITSGFSAGPKPDIDA